MSFTEAQRSARNEIYRPDGGSPSEDIQIALNVAYIESTVGLNLNNPNSTASGLFQYLDGTWNAYHSSLGEKNDQSNQIQAFYNDLATYTNWFHNPDTNGNIPDDITFAQYVYIKHHDGRSYTNFSEAPSLSIYNNKAGNGPPADFDVYIDGPGEHGLVVDSSTYVNYGVATCLDPVGCIMFEDGCVYIDYFLEYSLTPEEREAIVDADPAGAFWIS